MNEIDRSKFNIIFNALHGKDGEDGNAQSYFEYLRIPYTHSGVMSSMCAMDKVTSKEIFRKNKILIPKSHTLNCKSFKKKNLKKVIKNLKISYPIVIKPSDEGSSIGVKICKNYKKLKSAYNSLKKIYKTLILEKFIGGQEVQVAVMNGKALGAIELKPRRGFYDYKAKYYRSAKTLHIMPANIQKKYNQVLKFQKRLIKL